MEYIGLLIYNYAYYYGTKQINEEKTTVDFVMLYLIQNNSVEIINLHLNNIINSTIKRNLWNSKLV